MRVWGTSLFPALAGSAFVSGLYVSFYILEHCVVAECPFKQAPAPPVPLHPRLRSEVVQKLLRFALFEDPWSAAKESFGCVTQSEVACVAMIVCAWCTSTCLILVFLACICPNPKRDELLAFRKTVVFQLLQGAIMLTYIVGVCDDDGYSAPTICMLWWSVKFLLRQLQAVLPLRSSAIRKAHQISLVELATLLTAYGLLSLSSLLGSVVLWSQVCPCNLGVMFECAGIRTRL
jgi:hypothetical protein